MPHLICVVDKSVAKMSHLNNVRLARGGLLDGGSGYWMGEMLMHGRTCAEFTDSMIRCV